MGEEGDRPLSRQQILGLSLAQRRVNFRAEPHHRNTFKLEDKGQYFFDDYLAAIDTFEERSLDIVIVDGMCRTECIVGVRRRLSPVACCIIGDDTDYRFVDPEKLLPGWQAVRLWGFKSTRDLRETTFFHRPN